MVRDGARRPVRIVSNATSDNLGGRNLAALEAIRETYEALDRWRARARQPEEPQPGSELDLDRVIWPWLPPFEVARQSLIAGTQHLNLARTAIEARDVYPTAHFTVLRGALVGASQAVWLLEPDSRVERQQRALRVIDDWYRRRIQYNDAVDATELSQADRIRLTDQTHHTRERKAAATRLWTATGTLGATERLELTTVIAFAASAVFPDPRLAREVKLLWRLTSGDAHALGWQLATRASTWTRSGDGLGVAAVGGNLQDIAEPFVASFRLLRRGWSLFDRRAEAPGGQP